MIHVSVRISNFRQVDAYNILEVAEELNLIGQHYAWVLTSSSIGEIEDGSGTGMHEGIIGKSLFICLFGVLLRFQHLLGFTLADGSFNRLSLITHL